MKMLLIMAALALFSSEIFADETNFTSEQIEAKYTAAIEGRAADLLKVLSLTDTNKIAHVHDVIITQYRSLNTWHGANDARLKSARADTNAVAEIRASLKVLHDSFLSKLAEDLTPDQIDQVKDKMTYGKVQFTLAGYLAQYPDLSEANKQEILKLLEQAREEAMDGGSAGEKTTVFQRYKGKINNYLSKQGVHSEKQKVSADTKTTVPAQ